MPAIGKRALVRAVDMIVTPCMIENERYAERSRKYAVICLAVIAVNALFLGAPLSIVAAIYDPNWMSYALGVCFIQCAITTSIIPYAYLRCTHTMPQWMVDFQVWTSIPAIVAGSITAHLSPSLFILAVMMVTALLLRVRLWYLYSFCIVVSCVMSQLVISFGNELPELRAHLLREPLLFERIVFMLGFLVLPAIFMSISVNRLMAEFVERADQADAAIAMNIAVADKLRRYDTDGVDIILKAHVGRVDAKLLEAFTAIQHNLQDYRPHLPDYVIAATTSDHEIVSSSIGSILATSFSDDSDDSEGDFNEEESFGDVQRNSMPSSAPGHTREVTIRRSSIPSHGSNNNHHHADRPPSSCENVLSPEYNGMRKVTTTSTHESGVRAASPSLEMSTEQHRITHFAGHATSVFIRFTLPHSNGPTPLKENRELVVSALNHCVLSASAHARAHRGALQYMQGNCLVVSFNAASRVTTHEAKACLFTLALKADTESFNGLVMQASIVTAPIVSFFAGGKGQLMLSVLGNFMTTHRSIHTYLQSVLGNDTSCIVISKSTMISVENFFETRHIGAIQPTPNIAAFSTTSIISSPVSSSSSPTAVKRSNNNKKYPAAMTTFPVIELVSKRVSTGADLEWMYEIANQNKNSLSNIHAILRRVINAAVISGLSCGNVDREEDEEECSQTSLDAAITVLTKHIQSHPDIILDRCVVSRLQPHLTSDGMSPLHDRLARLVVRTSTPTPMW